MPAQDRPESPTRAQHLRAGDRAASAATVGILLLLAGGGAAGGPEGLSLGVPSLGLSVLAAAASALVWFSRTCGLAGLLLPALVALLGSLLLPALSSALLFSGPPLWPFGLAGLVLAVQTLGRRPPRSWLLPAFYAIYAAVAYQAQSRVGPDGDEPQYLMVAESLLRDRDFALDADFREARYAAFFSRPLEPHFRIRGPEGQIYSLHAVGLSILILPAYAIGGYAGASFFMALLAALLVREIRRLLLAVTGDAQLSEGTAWIVGLSPPLIHFAGLIFTEIPAALLLCLGLRAAFFGASAGTALVAALCAAALPWLNVRYAILAVAVVGALAWRLWAESGASLPVLARLRRGVWPAVILAGSAFAIGLYHYSLWGFWDPRRVYGRRREFGLEVLPEGLPGLFFDQEFGLFVYAPVFVLSIAGLVHLFRQKRVLAVAMLFALAGVIGTASVWPMWRGGFNPPSRFLVPLISILACGLALSLRRGLRPAAALLVGWGLWCGLSGAMNIDTIHRDRDGVAPFFRTQSGAREWTAALPSFVLAEDRATRALAWPWALLLAIPLGSALRPTRPGDSSRPVHARDSLLASAALVAIAMAADVLSPRTRSPERDATRLLGAPSLAFPSLRFAQSTDAQWPLDVFFEPHRYPEGQTIARSLMVPAGSYELTLWGEEGVGGPPPSLVIIQSPSGARTMHPLRVDGPSLSARLSLDASSRVDLAIFGGEPRTLRSIHLRPGR